MDTVVFTFACRTAGSLVCHSGEIYNLQCEFHDNMFLNGYLSIILDRAF